ncbi:MAG: DegT/DnrJ/EryC1/StrS family aminotransferase [Chitinispirillaceae bacterium]|nr:DegT/DnrJ/EryC1/StrS family aminotransferase [Chitinispirillaceae bacterium]
MIPFNDLRRHYASCKETVDAAVASVLCSGNYIMGAQLSAFEREFAEYIGVRYCVGVASGTEAIALALMAFGIGPGDEVITTGLTAYPTITGIMQANARPIVADITLEDGLIDCRSVEARITGATRAIIAVHLYGQCCDMDSLRECARRHHLYLIEDAAQAAGSVYKGRKAGSLGDGNAFSFYPTKNLGAFGDGGAITTDSETTYQRLLMLRNYGQRRRYYHDEPGINSRLDELQAAILRAKLRFLDGWNRRRAQIADRYRSRIRSVTCLIERDYGVSNHHLFVVRHDRRDAFMKHMEENGVQTLIHYPVPVNLQKAYPGRRHDDLAVSKRFAGTICSLPMYPDLTDEQVTMIVEAANGFKG